MSDFSKRVVELLRQLEFPGAEKFDETDIELMSSERCVMDFFVKISTMDFPLFLNKDQLRIIQLAGEMDDAEFVPTEADAVRELMQLIENKRRRDKILQLRLQHRRDERRQLEEAIATLEADEKCRAEHCNKRDIEAESDEQLRRIADTRLNKAHERVQSAITMVMSKGRLHLKKLTNVVDELKQSNGLRNVVDQEKYVTLANCVVDTCETLHGIVNRPEPDPEQYAVPVGDDKGVYVLKTLRDTSILLNEQCSDILSVILQFSPSSPYFTRFEKALTSYRESVQDCIQMFINEVFESTSQAAKRQLQQLESVATSLEAVVWAQRCILSEEIAFLQNCHEMLESGDEWARTMMSALPGIDSGAKQGAAGNRTLANVTQMSEGASCLGAYSQGTLLSSTLLESSLNSTVGSHYPSMSITGAGNTGNLAAQLWRTPQVLVQIENTLSTTARLCSAFYQTCEAMQVDRRILRGHQGVEVISDAGQAQLESLRSSAKKKKGSIMRLLDGRDELVKDRVRQNEAHHHRTLMPLFIVDPDSFEAAVEQRNSLK